jgi:hypothetical protein
MIVQLNPGIWGIKGKGVVSGGYHKNKKVKFPDPMRLEALR